MSDDNRLAEIEARLNSATPGPWVADTGVRGDCVVWGPNGRFLMNMQSEPHWLQYPGETRLVSFDVDRRDAEFIAAAREDVSYLLAELRKGNEDTRRAITAYLEENGGEYDLANSESIKRLAEDLTRGDQL